MQFHDIKKTKVFNDLCPKLGIEKGKRENVDTVQIRERVFQVLVNELLRLLIK